jgi:hypothetical protein
MSRSALVAGVALLLVAGAALGRSIVFNQGSAGDPATESRISEAEVGDTVEQVDEADEQSGDIDEADVDDDDEADVEDVDEADVDDDDEADDGEAEDVDGGEQGD